MPIKQSGWTAEKKMYESAQACDWQRRYSFRIYGLPHFFFLPLCTCTWINVYAEHAILTQTQPHAHEIKIRRLVRKCQGFKIHFLQFFNLTHDFCRQYVWLMLMVSESAGREDECIRKLLTAVRKLLWKWCTKLNWVDNNMKEFVVAVRAHFEYWFGYFIRGTHTHTHTHSN